MKKRPHHQSNESAKDRPHFNALSTASEAFRQKLIRVLFPEKAPECFECGTKLTDKNRKRIVTAHKMPEGVAFSGHQVCKPCAALMQSGNFLKLPKISADLAAAQFNVMGATAPCVGGMQ